MTTTEILAQTGPSEARSTRLTLSETARELTTTDADAQLWLRFATRSECAALATRQLRWQREGQGR